MISGILKNLVKAALFAASRYRDVGILRLAVFFKRIDNIETKDVDF